MRSGDDVGVVLWAGEEEEKGAEERACVVFLQFAA